MLAEDKTQILYSLRCPTQTTYSEIGQQFPLPASDKHSQQGDRRAISSEIPQYQSNRQPQRLKIERTLRVYLLRGQGTVLPLNIVQAGTREGAIDEDQSVTGIASKGKDPIR